MLNKKKRAKFIDFQKKILTPFCKKGLGQPAKKSLMSGFKDGGGVMHLSSSCPRGVTPGQGRVNVGIYWGIVS